MCFSFWGRGAQAGEGMFASIRVCICAKELCILVA